MKDSNPPRLLEAADEDLLLRDVLRAAKEETMPAPRVTQTLARFEATKLQGGGQAGAPTKPASFSFWRSNFPIGLGASLALVCAIGAVVYLRDGSPAIPMPSSGAGAPIGEAARSPAPLTETTASTRVEDLPAAPSPTEHAAGERATNIRTAPLTGAGPAPAARPGTSLAAKPSAASTFQEQLALLETARSALARGDTEACLRTTDRYDERFRSGLFSDEIAVMRIEALAARGDHARAQTLGEAFLARNPDSAYASRLRSILTTTP